MKDQKMIVIGNVDPVDVVKKLKKFWHTEILPAKEVKKEEPKKEEPWKGFCPPMATYYYTPHPEEYQNNCVIC
jgi:hypothetical protein